MASSNPRHVRNRVRGSSGVGLLFKWVAVGSPMERKSMEAWASQGDGGFRNEQIGCAK